MGNTYIDFLFEDEDSGEQFFVEIKLEECGSYKEARKKAKRGSFGKFFLFFPSWELDL